MGNNNDYIIEYGSYDDEMINKVVELFSKSFDWTTKFTFDYIKWQYIDNPNGKVVSYNAFDGKHILVAHYAAIPIKMIIDGEIVPGLLSLNTATHPEHQGKRLFTRLASLTYEKAQELGYQYVIGVANANSTHGFLKKLGFKFIAPLDFKVGVGNIFKKAQLENKNRVLYDHDTLMWRLRCPAYSYSAKNDCIYSKRPEPLFHSCFAKMPYGETIAGLGLNKTFDLFNIYVGIGLDPKSGLYFNLPKFVKRSPFNLIFKDLTEGKLSDVSKDNVYFQLIDFDVA